MPASRKPPLFPYDDLGPKVTDLEPVIDSERDAIAEELARARALLRDGMGKLYDFFDALRGAMQSQSALLATLRDATATSGEREAVIAQLLADHERVLGQSESAILGLQLEDVLGQLLEYTGRRVDGLSTIAAAIAEVIDHTSLAQNRELQARLRALLTEIHARAQERMVAQESLGSGDVELF